MPIYEYRCESVERFLLTLSLTRTIFHPIANIVEVTQSPSSSTLPPARTIAKIFGIC